MTELTDLSETDADNTVISTINIAEGCPPGNINNGMRAGFGLIRRMFRSSIFRVRDVTDQTKLLAFDLSGLTTATTRTFSVPDRSGMIAVAENYGIAASVAGSALTVSLKGADGNDPSATNIVNVAFRNVSLPVGTPSVLSISAATSVVVSSGSTMGFTSATAGRLWVVGFNDGGTFRLGVVNALSGTSVMALRDGIYSSTAEGGAGAADSAHVIYTGTAVSAKALTVLGYMDWSAGLTTAGAWGIVPTAIQIRTGITHLPGDLVQSASSASGALINSALTIPIDNTIPQNNEGVQAINQAITPTAAANLLHVRNTTLIGSTATDAVTAALFRDSAADASAATGAIVDNSNANVSLVLEHWTLAASASSTDFKVRAGAASGGTSINGVNGGARYGGVGNTTITVQEIMA